MRLVVSSYCRTPRMLPCSTPRYKKICRFLYAHFIELCVWWSRRTVVLLACCHAPPRDIRKYAVFVCPFYLVFGLVVCSYYRTPLMVACSTPRHKKICRFTPS